MVTKNGVAAIPFLVLVDREGTAIALNTRGSALGEKLAELIPDAAPTSDTAPGVEPTSSDPANSAPPAEKAAPAENSPVDDNPPQTRTEATAESTSE